MNLEPLRELERKWEARSRSAFPADAMLINMQLRELREALAQIDDGNLTHFRPFPTRAQDPQP